MFGSKSDDAPQGLGRRMLISLRSGSWLTAERLRLYAIVILVASALELPLLFAANSHAPFGVDFVVTWAADRSAVTGADFYDGTVTLATERAATGIPDFFPFPYPPTYALVTAPLGMLPYRLALALWMIVGTLAFLASLLLLTRGRGKLLILAFPAVIINVVNGQNGLVFGALLAAALAVLKARPVVAGVLIGFLSTKPHLGMLIPIALLAGREWRAFLAASATVIALALASLAIFGVAPWREFLATSEIYRTELLTAGNPILAKIVTAFAAAQRLGVGSAVAYGIEGCILIGAALFVWRVWRGDAPVRLKQESLIFSALLATPYLFDYDLALLGPAIAAAAVGGLEEGFLPWEKSVLALLWFLPAVARPVTMLSDFPIVPAFVLLGLTFTAYRARGSAACGLRYEPER
jgi:alpha-1,2-mannosyltransferase